MLFNEHTQLCCILFVGIAQFINVSNGDPLVTSPWGTVKGSAQRSPYGKPYNAYLGIPYAVPPVGDLRFKKPKPHPGPKGPFEAHQYGYPCPQHGKFRQSEDCLTLNIYQPSVLTGEQFPVMVWIHGGGFEAGAASNYKPWKMVTEGDVIVVVIQYRLGALGFLSTESDNLPGNYALWDMTLALQWVKDNIGQYHGNADNVTIFGESAGSKAVSYLMLSHTSKQLFHRAIMQSGSATGYYSFRHNPRDVAVKLAKGIGCFKDIDAHPSNQDLEGCFRNISASKLAKYSDPSLDLATFASDLTWAPSVDHDFLIDTPRNLVHNVSFLREVDFYDKDLLVGVNNQEGSFFVGRVSQYASQNHVNAMHDVRTLDFYRRKLIPLILTRLCDGFDNSSVDVIAKTYVSQASQSKLLTIEQVMNTQSDASIVAPSVEVATAHARAKGLGKTYLYLFDHYPSFLTHTSGFKGMTHARDIMYSFGLNIPDIKKRYHRNVTAAELELSKTFAAIYTTFAHSGDPNSAISGHVSSNWPQYDDVNQRFLSLSTKMVVKSRIYPVRMSTWLKQLPASDQHCRTGASNSHPIIG